MKTIDRAKNAKGSQGLANASNNKEATINSQFTNEDARIKLKRRYPTILD
jgi:hypothetical protein